MKLFRTLFLVLFLLPTIIGFGQSCEDQVVQYFLYQDEPCGHHGSLRIDLLGNTATEKAEDFVYNWKNTFFSDYSSEVAFDLDSERSGSSISVFSYAMTYNGIAIEGASLSLTFNNSDELITYNCNNASELPRGLIRAAISSNLKSSSLAKTLVHDYELGELISSKNIIRIEDEMPVLVSLSQWLTVDGTQEIFVEIDPLHKRLVIEPIAKRNRAASNVQVFRTTGGSGGGSSGTVVVSDNNIDCGTQTISVAGSNYQMPTSQAVNCSSGSVVKHEFRKIPSAGGFSLVPEQCFESLNCDFTDNCSSSGIKYQMANVIHHVTAFYLGELQSVSGVLPDFDFEIGSTSAPYNVTSPIVGFGTNGLQNPAAEDISYIKAAALDKLLQQNFTLQPSGMDGIRFGYLDYILYRDLGYTNLFTHANPSASRSLINSDEYVLGINEEEGAQVWSGTLYEVEQVTTGNSDALALLLDLLAMTDPNNTQEQEVENLISIAENRTDIITPEELCAIKNIVAERYKELEFTSVQDFYIKDNTADVGNDPNNQNGGGNFWSSPDIWNCNNGSCSSHETPRYEGPGTLNYVQVKLTQKGCKEFGDATGYVKVIITVAQGFQNYYAGHFNPPLGLDAAIAHIPISAGDVQTDGSAIYSFPWPVFNPEDPAFEDLVSDNGRLHVCVRALIISDDDPMFLDDWNGMYWNNNIAQDNMSIIDDFEGLIPPDGGAVFLANPKFDPINGNGNGNGTGGPTPVNKVPTRIQLNVIGPGDPVRLVNENDITVSLDDATYGTWQEGGERGRGFTYERYRRDRNGSRTVRYWHVFHITDPNFALESLMFEENSLNQIRVNVKRSESFTPFDFDLELVDETEECMFGGERYSVREAVARLDRRDTDNITLATVTIAPNPVIDELAIEFSQDVAKVEIVSTDGTSMYVARKEISKFITVDVSTYANGAYLVKTVFRDGQIKTKKFIKL